MTVAKWGTITDAGALQDRVNRMFDEIFPATGERSGALACAWKPAVDILETEAGIVITADLPGVRKSDVRVETRDSVLTLKGERRWNDPVEKTRCHKKERCEGAFQRSFSLGFAPSPDKITAALKNGVLTIRIPWPEADPRQRVSVDV